MFFSNWIVSDKEEKEYFDWNGDMNTMIHDIMYRMNDKYIWNNIKLPKHLKHASMLIKRLCQCSNNVFLGHRHNLNTYRDLTVYFSPSLDFINSVKLQLNTCQIFLLIWLTWLITKWGPCASWLSMPCFWIPNEQMTRISDNLT